PADRDPRISKAECASPRTLPCPRTRCSGSDPGALPRCPRGSRPSVARHKAACSLVTLLEHPMQEPERRVQQLLASESQVGSSVDRDAFMAAARFDNTMPAVCFVAGI